MVALLVKSAISQQYWALRARPLCPHTDFPCRSAPKVSSMATLHNIVLPIAPPSVDIAISPPGPGQQSVSVKDHQVNILDFAGCVVSVALLTSTLAAQKHPQAALSWVASSMKTGGLGWTQGQAG